MLSTVFLFCKINLTMWRLLQFYINFRSFFFFFFLKDAIGVMVGIALNLSISLGSIKFVNNINPSNTRMWDSFLFICEFFAFLPQCLQFSGSIPFTSLIKFTPKYFYSF